jgi:hypothetical protein
LQVINSSPGDLAPVFDAMLAKTMRLCEAAHGHLLTCDGDVFYLAAIHGESQFVEFCRHQGTIQPSDGNPLALLLRGERVVHVADAREDGAYGSNIPAYREVIDRGGIRTSLTVSLGKDGEVLGAIRVYRQEVRPFSEKQIALVPAGDGSRNRPRPGITGRTICPHCRCAEDEPYRTGDPVRRALVHLGGARAGLNMPIARQRRLLPVCAIELIGVPKDPPKDARAPRGFRRRVSRAPHRPAAGLRGSPPGQ